MTRAPVAAFGVPVCLAAADPPAGVTPWHAVVSFCPTQDGTEAAGSLVALAVVSRDGPIVRLVTSDTFEDPAAPARAWLEVAGGRVRVMVATVGTPFQFRVVAFGPTSFDSSADSSPLATLH